MKEKIVSYLTQKYAKTGINKNAIDTLASMLTATIQTEDDIDRVCGAEGVESSLKALQADADSLRTANTELQKKLNKPKTETKAEVKTEDGESNAILESVKALLNPVIEQVNKLAGDKAHDTHISSVKADMAAKKIPAHFYEPIILDRKFESKEAAEALTAKIVDNWAKFQQVEANELLKAGETKPIGGLKSNSAAIKADVEAWAKASKTENI